MASCFEFRAALETANLSQTEFAELIDVERSTVWRWYEGQRTVPRYAMIAVSAAVGHDAEQLRRGQLRQFHIKKHHVYRDGETFRELASRWHPDKTRRNTNEEMSLVNKYRQ